MEKYRRLKGWCGTAPKERENGGYGEKVISFSTLSREDLFPIWKRFYPKGRKVLSLDMLEEFWGPEMLAWWLMDDGSCHSKGRMLHIHTENFPHNEVDRAARWMTNKGFKTSSCRARKYKILVVSVEGSKQLAEMVEPFIIPSLRYKIDPILATREARYCSLCGEEVEGGKLLYCAAPLCQKVARTIGSSFYKGTTAKEMYERLINRRCAVCDEHLDPLQSLRSKTCQSKICERSRAIFNAQKTYYKKPKETLSEIRSRLES
jgi:hypothetical protein